MADFKTAFALTSKWEGGYVNNAADKGGETYRGISRKNWPNWDGWKAVDYIKENHGPLKINQLIDFPALDAAVQSFYNKNYWEKVMGDKINSQGIANILFDWSVTSGYHPAKAIQKIVGAVPDGVIGPITVLLINKGCQEAIFDVLKNNRIKFYKDIVTRDESQRVFLKGWLNRTNSFTFQ